VKELRIALRRAPIVLAVVAVSLPARSRRPGAGAPGSGNAPGASGAPGGGGAPGGSGGPAAGRGGFFRFRSDPKLQAAFKACGANFGARGGQFRRISRVNITKFVACVRQHGYDLPTPNLSGKGPTFPPSIRTNKKFLAASRSCLSVLRPPGGGAPPSS
jgi:hypothetical protein